MLNFAPIHWLIWISSFESIKCLKGSPVSLAVVNRDTNLNPDYLKEITGETTTENPNPDDITLGSGPQEPEEENRDTSKTIIIIVGVMIVFILLTIFNHVIVPKVNLCNVKYNYSEIMSSSLISILTCSTVKYRHCHIPSFLCGFWFN